MAIISLELPEIHDNEVIYLQRNGTFSPELEERDGQTGMLCFKYALRTADSNDFDSAWRFGGQNYGCAPGWKRNGKWGEGSGVGSSQLDTGLKEVLAVYYFYVSTEIMTLYINMKISLKRNWIVTDDVIM